jgi:heme-NO-binding protein
VKGIVFNLLEQLVRKEFGDSEWNHVRQDADVDGAFASLDTYPDAALRKLIAAVGKRAQKTPGEALQWFGRHSMPLLALQFPQLFAGQDSTRSFVLTLNDIIHPEVRRLYPGADVPVFDFDTSSPDALTLGYHSPRKLCALAHGFIEGAADHYGESVEVEQSECMHRGDAKCVFQLRFSPRAQ